MSVGSGFDFVITTLRSIVEITNSTAQSTTTELSTSSTATTTELSTTEPPVADNVLQNITESLTNARNMSGIDIKSLSQIPVPELSNNDTNTEVMMNSTPPISRQVTELLTSTYDKIIFPDKNTTLPTTPITATTQIMTTTTATTLTTTGDPSTTSSSTLTTLTDQPSTDFVTATTESVILNTTPPSLQEPSPLQEDVSWMDDILWPWPVIIIIGCIAFLLLSCCVLYYFCKFKKNKKYDNIISTPGKRMSPLHCEILNEINKDIDKKDEEKKMPMIMTDLTLSRSSSSLSIRSTASTTTIMSISSKGDISPLPTTSPFGQEVSQLIDVKSSSRSSSSTREKSSSASPMPTSPYGRELDWLWDSYGNWSTYADNSNQSFWKTRLSEPLEPADNSYSSVDWIIQDSVVTNH